MPKYPFIFLILLLFSNAYALELDLNQKSFAPNDKLVIFGTAIPNDSLIIELFNPTGNLIYRSQLDVGANGEFATILLEWPEPDNDTFRVGTYTLTITSSINPELSVSEAIIYQIQQSKDDVKVENSIKLDLVTPLDGIINKEIPIIAYATLNDAPLIGLESIIGEVRYPDGSYAILDNFTLIDDAIYKTSFTSNIQGYHTVIVNIKHQELLASKAVIVNIDESTDNSNVLDDALDELSVKIDSLDDKLTNNTDRINNNVSSIKESVDDMTSAIGQLTSLLLPIVGMIAIIVALQATILAKRK